MTMIVFWSRLSLKCVKLLYFHASIFFFTEKFNMIFICAANSRKLWTQCVYIVYNLYISECALCSAYSNTKSITFFSRWDDGVYGLYIIYIYSIWLLIKYQSEIVNTSNRAWALSAITHCIEFCIVFYGTCTIQLAVCIAYNAA